jgi:hypothetical protein
MGLDAGTLGILQIIEALPLRSAAIDGNHQNAALDPWADRRPGSFPERAPISNGWRIAPSLIAFTRSLYDTTI